MGYDCCDFCMGPVHGDEHRTCVNRCSKWLRKHAKRLIRELETDLARVTAERDKLQAENARLRHLMLWARDEDLPPAAGGDWDAFCEMDAEYNAACGYVPPCHGDEFCCCPQCAVLRGEVPGV